MSTSCDTNQCVIVFGAASLQQYIFQSNRLKENIGASYLAKHWLGEALVTVTGADATEWKEYEKNPWRNRPKNPIAKDKPINVIYIGGGNAALLCKDRKTAENAVRDWSCKVLKEAPGLRVVVGYGEVCKHKSLAEAYRAGLDQLNLCEEALPFGTALHSLPVVRSGISTGLPASESRTEPGEGDQWISQSAASKRDQISLDGKPGAAQKYIKKIFPSVLCKTDRLPKLSRFAIKLDEELGGRKGESHIAVVHADGNGMGVLLNKVIEGDQGDDDFLHNLRAFSASTAALSHKALEKTLLHFKTFLPLKSLNNSDDIFPLRPIVFGGDDLTFVCDGRVGLHLAAYYLNQFASGDINFFNDKKSVDACAGVAIVPTKFPFARAYGFADDLCGEAKLYRRYKAETKLKGSWLDFQIIQEGAMRSITDLRKTQYHTGEGQTLHQRPYEVPTEWEDFVTFLQKLKTKWPRSRAKRLLQVLTRGPIETKNFIGGTKWNKDGIPSVENTPDTVRMNGWDNETSDAITPYFDPLEALDFYLEELLPKKKDNDKKEEGE